VETGNAEVLAELRLMRKTVDKVEDKVDKSAEDAHETHILLKKHCEDFEKYKTEMDPVRQDFVKRKAVKEERSERLKGLSWKVGILAGIIGILSAIMSGGK
jgi:uncharacterized coiled-coil DUF342 family protein